MTVASTTVPLLVAELPLASALLLLGTRALHQRGIIQLIVMVVGGMVLGFLLAKAILLTREINAHHRSGVFKLKDASRQTAEMVLSMSEQGRSLLARRTSNFSHYGLRHL